MLASQWVPRSGDIDPSVVTFIMKKEGLTPDEMERILNKESGILALSGVTQDCRDMEAAAAEGNEQARTCNKNTQLFNCCTNS